MSRTKHRSWLLVPMTKPELIAEAQRSGADVIVLDLIELIAEKNKTVAREKAQSVIGSLRSGNAEIFAQVDPHTFDADLRACVWPGLSGIVVSRAESPQQINDIAALLGKLESERGLPQNTLKIVPALETAPGNHVAYAIAGASPRISALTLGRADLIMDLRPEPSGEIHLMQYLMQRLIIVAGAAGITPLGAWWRGADRGLLATPDNTYAAAHRGRAIGFKGAMCLCANQVEPLNRAFAQG